MPPSPSILITSTKRTKPWPNSKPSRSLATFSSVPPMLSVPPWKSRRLPRVAPLRQSPRRARCVLPCGSPRAPAPSDGQSRGWHFLPPSSLPPRLESQSQPQTDHDHQLPHRSPPDQHRSGQHRTDQDPRAQQ